MCGNTCNGTGNLQRLRSLLKEQEALLGNFQEIHDQLPASEASTAMLNVVANRIITLKGLVSKAEDRANHETTPINLIGMAG